MAKGKPGKSRPPGKMYGAPIKGKGLLGGTVRPPMGGQLKRSPMARMPGAPRAR
jgi:hypothetical protein